MTLSVYKQNRIMELKDMGLSVRKTAKKLHISKTTVVKYLKFFKQGYNPSQVNIKPPRKNTSISQNQMGGDKICLPRYSNEDDSESDISKDSKEIMNEKIIKLEHENKRLTQLSNEQHNVLMTQKGEITNLEEELDEYKDQLIENEEEIKKLKLEQYNKYKIYEEKKIELKSQFQEQLKSKDEEINKLKQEHNSNISRFQEQLKIKNKENIKLKQDITEISGIKDKLEEFRRKDDQWRKKVKEIRELQDKALDNETMQKVVLEELHKYYSQDPKSYKKDNQDKESNKIKTQELQTIKKTDFQVNKSIDYKFGSTEDKLIIGALSLISFLKGITGSKKNDNQIILLDENKFNLNNNRRIC